MLIRSLDRRLLRYEKTLKRTAEGFLKFFKEKRQLEIYIVNSKQIQKLNLQYRKQNKPTDVLAIEPPDFPDAKKQSLGEIYLNPSYLKTKPYDVHYILVHGLLHLLGFTHKKKGDNMEMQSKEKEVLKWLEHKY